MKNIILFIALILTFVSCNNKKNANPVKNIDTVYVNDEIETKYSICFPSDYEKSKKYPLIISLDPHADGKKAIENIRKGAEFYDFILAGSYNVKNGMPNPQIFVDAMLKDIEQKYNINKNLIIISGFSGGARVAGYYSAINKDIKAVVSDGAAIQPKNANHDIFYIGMAGYEDFNFLEIIITHFQRLPFKSNDLLIFKGKHEWAPKQLWANAIGIIKLKANKQGVINMPDYQKDTLYKNLILMSDTSAAKNDFLAQKIAFDLIQSCFDTDSIKNANQILSNSAQYKKEMQKLDSLLSYEIAMQQNYAQSFERSTKWWQKQVIAINENIKKSENSNERYMYARLKNFLSIVAYTYTNQAINTKQYDRARHYLEIYKIVDPENPDVEKFEKKLKIQTNKL